MTSTSSQPVSFLLVDDLAENLTALGALLRRPGLALLQARTGQEALELLLKHEVALAIVDVQMPGMNGFELAELMRGTERTRRVPIIFVTAGVADRQRRFRGYEAGAVDFLSKPIEPDILRSKAEVFFELFRQRQEVAQQRDELTAATERIQALLKESQQQAAALREADQRKDEFLATLAHELRNPLAPIRNAVELLRLNSPEATEIQGAIEIAGRQVRHMARLIDDLLDVARIVKGKIELRMERCDVVEIVRNTVEDYRPTLASTGVDLDVVTKVDRLTVLGDSIRIAQMVGNLVHNAGKFTPAGGSIIVHVATDATAKNAVITITDTGCGFESFEATRFFEPFSQVTGDDRKGGLGLGLALTKGLIQLHGGHVKGESRGRGQGATFTLNIPLASHIAERIERGSVEALRANGRSLSILVIEDNMDAARSLQMLLSRLGHRVDVAHDGATGLAMAKETLPDVVISDLGLPGDLDGYAVAEAIRNDKALGDLHLIALSGFGRTEDQQKAQQAGFNEHLVKPVDLTVLQNALAGASNQ
jgi:signal transduction histidine kinase